MWRCRRARRSARPPDRESPASAGRGMQCPSRRAAIRRKCAAECTPAPCSGANAPAKPRSPWQSCESAPRRVQESALQREKQEFQQQQENIKKKHHIEDEDVVVVEKSNMVKFFVKLLLGIIRFAASAAIIILAAIGLITIVYPEPREELMAVLTDIFYELIGMFV